MTERVQRLLADALQAKRQILVNPTDEEIRQHAEQSRAEGTLRCTACREAITDEAYVTRRIRFAETVMGVAHLHKVCEAAFVAGLESTEAVDRAEGANEAAQ